MTYPIVELRQYTLHPGRRDDLIELFDREFVETQEAAGLAVLGQFRDLRDPDRFVWLRGFTDMPSRAAALSRFYGGPVWAAHRDAANATMIDSDDVLLLRPLDGGFPLPPSRGTELPQSRFLAALHFADAPFETFPPTELPRWPRSRRSTPGTPSRRSRSARASTPSCGSPASTTRPRWTSTWQASTPRRPCWSWPRRPVPCCVRQGARSASLTAGWT
jgi:hypothetical protein